MNITEETKKIGGSSLIRYGVLFIGLCILLLGQSVITWKTSSERDAAGKVDAIQFEIKDLERAIEESEDSAEKRDMRDEIKELKEEELPDARFEADAERVDARSDLWITNMVKMGGLVIASLGLLIIAATGGSHERIGALVALGFIMTRIF